MQRLGAVDVALLAPLRSTAEQNDQAFAISGEIDALSRPPVDYVLANAIEPFHARCVAHFQPQLGDRHLGRSLCIQAVEPCFVWAEAVFAQIFFDSSVCVQIVTNMLP